MSATEVIRCDKCDRAHIVKIRDPRSTQSFNFSCRCLTKISGMFTTGRWEVTNAKMAERKEDEAIYMHEPTST